MVFCSRLLHFFADHPLSILFLSIMAGLISLIYFMAKKKATVLLFLLFPVLGVVNFVEGSAINNWYVNRHGAPGTGVVTQMTPTGALVHHLQELRYSSVLKTADGRTVDCSFTNNGNVYYPPVTFVVPPSVGELFTVRYIPGDETNFIICTADSGSIYVQRIFCLDVLTRLDAARATYLLDSSNAAYKAAYKAAISALMSSSCDTALRERYRAVQPGMDK